jgi:predicted nucleic acid-binding protein
MKKMKRKMRIYLDTSVISALFDERNPERKSLTKAFFKEIGNFETFISEITVVEIERTLDMQLRSKMKEVATWYRRRKYEQDRRERY